MKASSPTPMSVPAWTEVGARMRRYASRSTSTDINSMPPEFTERYHDSGAMVPIGLFGVGRPGLQPEGIPTQPQRGHVGQIVGGVGQ